ncbi:AMP-binding protein [Anthocerotibacter panamensis]|uniref:AMP-binding protein n=1 Tax=Anthocerotibacter panamensis TaxID=2857077 RepID=UPI001C4040A5|nr:AMP-binding protein [Anthocerotibacter panamensis]
MAHVLERLVQRAVAEPTAPCVRILPVTGAEVTLTCLQLLDCARSGWAVLAARGVRAGDRLLISLPTGVPLLTGLLGAFWGGAVPALVAPCTGRGGVAFEQEWRARVHLLQPQALLCDFEGPDPGIPLIRVQDIRSRPATLSAGAWDWDRLAYIQFSSGATGAPKGVALTWRAIHANLEAMGAGLPMTAEDRAFSWLPLYHDMGLFGSFLLSLYCRAPLTLMDPARFARNPLRWFERMAEERSTITATPPSALCSALTLLRRSKVPLDLASVTQFIVGSEHIPPRLVQEFYEVLVTHHAVTPTALRPVYGLAEATLAVTIPPCYRPPLRDTIHGPTLAEQGYARPHHEEASQSWVAVGQPLAQIHVRIVATDGSDCPERRVGTVWVQSPALAQGSIDAGNFLPRVGAWLDTGDLGYRVGDELFIVGRSKDLILKKGRNYAPERLEDLALLQTGVRRVCAFGVYEETIATERVILLVEVQRLGGPSERDRLRLTLRSQLGAAGYEVDEVHFLPKGSLPLTTSGKLRRHHARALFLAGELS